MVFPIPIIVYYSYQYPIAFLNGVKPLMVLRGNFVNRRRIGRQMHVREIMADAEERCADDLGAKTVIATEEDFFNLLKEEIETLKGQVPTETAPPSKPSKTTPAQRKRKVVI